MPYVRGHEATTAGSAGRFCRGHAPAARLRSRGFTRATWPALSARSRAVTSHGRWKLAASSLRSFFRFLRAAGLREDRLADAVPMIPHRPAGLVRHLDPGRFAELTASLASSSPRGLRDMAIILFLARLGLRASEVVALRLEDLDWRNATVRVRARKTGHGALLPLPGEVGAALADYLQHGRPGTPARQVFVQVRQRLGAPISSSIVGHAVDSAPRRAGMDAPVREANLLRHSLATGLLGRGASFARSLTCSAIPRWRRPGSTPRWEYRGRKTDEGCSVGRARLEVTGRSEEDRSDGMS